MLHRVIDFFNSILIFLMCVHNLTLLLTIDVFNNLYNVCDITLTVKPLSQLKFEMVNVLLYKYSSRSCNPQSVLSGELSCSAIFISHMYASYHDVITCIIRYQYSFSEYTLAWLPHATSHSLTYMRSILSQINYLYYVLFISYILTVACQCLVRKHRSYFQ